MRYLLADGYEQFYEIGPGRVLRGLLKRIDRKVNCENVSGVDRRIDSQLTQTAAGRTPAAQSH